ncbi:hypothetical protein [Bordetella bronchialis]|uniref:hypothetical protein n=1 Tax=Bordetella bronchialis TaxID=463025 RepID=UPI0012EAB1FC|nr:hypothetical protein [Bordetella bronchialis]
MTDILSCGHLPFGLAGSQFGRIRCGVARPETVIERIATAMEEALRDEAPRIDSALLARMKAEWEDGYTSARPSRIFRNP